MSIKVVPSPVPEQIHAYIYEQNNKTDEIPIKNAIDDVVTYLKHYVDTEIIKLHKRILIELQEILCIQDIEK